jgi:outer membrane protein
MNFNPKKRAVVGILILVLSVFPLSLKADPFPSVWSLEDSIERAFRESTTLKSSQLAVEGAEFKQKQALAGFFPKLSTQYRYTYLNTTPTMTIPPLANGIIPETKLLAGTNNNYYFNVTIEQPLFTGLALTRTYELAKLGLDVSKIKLEEDRLALAYKVKETYWGILRSEKMKSVAEQSVVQIADHVRVAQDFYNVGVIPLNDLLKAEVQLADAKQNLVRAENSLALAKSNFNTVLRIPLERDTEVRDILQYHPFPKALSECQYEAAQKRPEIKEIETQIQMARKNVQLAESEYYPQFALQTQYKKEGDNPAVSGSPFVDSDSWAIMAVMRWNFWEWGKTRYLVQERKKGEEQVKESLVQIKDMIQLEVKEAFLYLRDSEKNIQLAEKTIQQAEENFRINQVRYREQVTTSLEVLDAQTLLAQAKNNYYQALYVYNLAHSRLVKAMGYW